LAGRAEKRASLALEAPNHTAATVWTGLPFLPIHEVVVLVATFSSIGCEKVPDTRSATGNRGLKNRLHRVVYLKSRGLTQVTDVPIRMQPGAKQYLVGIDIPDTCNDLLTHEQGLESSTPAL